MKTFPMIVGLALLTTASAATAQAPALPKASPAAQVMQMIGGTKLTISYHRPAVKGRAVWGGLVPYDQVWRAGANDATTFEFTEAVKIDGKDLPAGLYGFFVIPQKDRWTVIFNKTAKQWGAYEYKEADDVMRFDVKPIDNEAKEYLTYSITPVTPNSANVVLAWEKVKINFRVESDLATAVKNAMEAAMKAEKKDARAFVDAAATFYDNNLDMNLALTWIEESVKIRPTMGNMALKGRIQARLGKKEDAIASLEKAIELAAAAKRPQADMDRLNGYLKEVKDGKTAK